MRVRIGGVALCLAIASAATVGWRSPQDAGIDLWRKPDKEGRACASCHSPDGIELAAYAFDDATIERRATPHLGVADGKLLAEYIDSVRSRLGIKEGRDPMADRPLQPGGQVLPGDSPVTRDRAFALSLGTVLPDLAAGRIGDLAQAKAALAEVLAVNLTKVRIGIPLDRLSEDVFHGKDHATLAHWIPDQILFTYSPEYEAAQARYLADPSEENLKALDGFYTRQWKAGLPLGPALALEKARCLLVLQHYLRTGRLAVDLPEFPDMTKAPANPFWDIGELARINANGGASDLHLPPDVVANKDEGPSFDQQFQSMRLPWLWLGWMIDPGLQRTSFDRRTRYGDWFSEFLVEGDYPAHAAFMLTKKMAEEAYAKNGWGSHSPQHLVLNFSWVLRNENWRSFAPSGGAYRNALNTFLANSFRMFALLQADELRRTGVTYMREPVVQQLKFMQIAAAAMDPKNAPADAPIFAAAIEAVQTAKLVS
ncbi:MAG TPA: hypothetical protein VMI31_02455 [Fimbriimonadaceae bacterium]|nr:hypothetical protein [Fimbriimonadaceae bacterium]